MTIRNVKKSLAGLEDILFGKGTVQQERNGNNYPITKLSLVWSCDDVSELADLDTTKITQALVAGVAYRFDGSVWVIDSLRSDLAADNGHSLLGAGGRTQADKNADIVSVLDKGADRTGITESTVAFLSAGYFAFVPAGTYLVDPTQVNINKYWGPGKLRYTTDLSEHWCGLVSKGTLYIRNDDRNPDTTPTVPADGLINLADGELKFLCDLDEDGDYDADIYGKNNLYIAGENSIHFRIDPQGPAEGRIRLASTTNTNFIQSGKDFSGSNLKNLAFGPYLSTDYWAFFSQSSGYCVLGNSASPAAPLHIYNQQTSAALAENTASPRARMGFKGSTTTSGTTVTFGADGNDAEVRAGGMERLIITADGFVRPASANTQFCGSNPFPWAGGFTQTAFTVTSDEECKTELITLDDKILDAWADVGWFKYKFKDRVELKGDGARWHFGTGARRVVEVFSAHGLDATDYAFLCYDRWDDVVASVQINEGETVTVKREISRPVTKKIKSFVDEKVVLEDGTVFFARREIEKEVPVTALVPVLHEDGTPVIGGNGEAVMNRINLTENVVVSLIEPAEPIFEDVVVAKAGERYGIRYEEVLVLEAMLLRRRLTKLETIVNAKT